MKVTDVIEATGLAERMAETLTLVHGLGAQAICPAEIGHRTATVCHLANIGYRLRRPLTWDPQAERFVNDNEADKLLFRKPREPWKYA